MLFGRKGCNEDTDWKVSILYSDDGETIVAEQLAHKEANEIYEELTKKVENSKKDFIELDFSCNDKGEKRTINIKQIRLIKIQRERDYSW